MSTVVPINPIVLGKISVVYGIRGWLKIISFTQSANSIFDYQPWFINISSTGGTWQKITIDDWKYHNNTIIIKSNSINNREEAKPFTNCQIIVEASQLPNLANGEYYWKDIIGCTIETLNGDQLGTVINLIETGSNDVMVVKTNLKKYFSKKNDLLIPFLYGQVIKTVDLTNRIIKVNWDQKCF
ncbi:ribosome maturation factor RimM [Candidatus Palibaumannia cicadellinicola]|uniref:Ribosome maturation factor RimM n=1 Tax=Candidatus Palibaumannia cicadellinicola TaxID=186490 RepID=A0A0K2BKD1_9GAMM|nr:ribosome maturation factor RimM [Candidatus Baumannia cicadellinicola]AKZ65780.1 16S rRNA processing protein [Candidatus Baumannia cicadellinicola]